MVQLQILNVPYKVHPNVQWLPSQYLEDMNFDPPIGTCQFNLLREIGYQVNLTRIKIVL